MFEKEFVLTIQIVQIVNIECYFIGLLGIGFVVNRVVSISSYLGQPITQSSHSSVKCR